VSSCCLGTAACTDSFDKTLTAGTVPCHFTVTPLPLFGFDHSLDIEDSLVQFAVATDLQLRQLQGEGAVRGRHRLQGQSLHLHKV
jgi:hypothetical protein